MHILESRPGHFSFKTVKRKYKFQQVKKGCEDFVLDDRKCIHNFFSLIIKSKFNIGSIFYIKVTDQTNNLCFLGYLVIHSFVLLPDVCFIIQINSLISLKLKLTILLFWLRIPTPKHPDNVKPKSIDRPSSVKLTLQYRAFTICLLLSEVY